MDGSRELSQLAELLRLGADTGRQVANLRPTDRDTIEHLAQRAEAIADELDAMIADGTPEDKAGLRSGHGDGAH